MPHGPRTRHPSDWLAEFEAAARRPWNSAEYAFIKTYKPSWMTRPIVPLTRWKTIAAGVRRIFRTGWGMAARKTVRSRRFALSQQSATAFCTVGSLKAA